eukprot:Clim_evm7s99 gene=Clim_evmTU7s99
MGKKKRSKKSVPKERSIDNNGGTQNADPAVLQEPSSLPPQVPEFSESQHTAVNMELTDQAQSYLQGTVRDVGVTRTAAALIDPDHSDEKRSKENGIKKGKMAVASSIDQVNAIAEDLENIVADQSVPEHKPPTKRDAAGSQTNLRGTAETVSSHVPHHGIDPGLTTQEALQDIIARDAPVPLNAREAARMRSTGDSDKHQLLDPWAHIRQRVIAAQANIPRDEIQSTTSLGLDLDDMPSYDLRRSPSGMHQDQSTQVASKDMVGMLPSDMAKMRLQAVTNIMRHARNPAVSLKNVHNISDWRESASNLNIATISKGSKNSLGSASKSHEMVAGRDMTLMRDRMLTDALIAETGANSKGKHLNKSLYALSKSQLAGSNSKLNASSAATLRVMSREILGLDDGADCTSTAVTALGARKKSRDDCLGPVTSSVQSILDAPEPRKSRLHRVENTRKDLGWIGLKMREFKLWRLRRRHENQFTVPIFRRRIKIIESELGTGVSALFVFLRSMFLVDLVLMVMWVSFIILPALIHPSDLEHQPFEFLNIFNGEGYMATTLFFYGGYGNEFGSFDMDMAYICVAIMHFVVSLFFLLHLFAQQFIRQQDSTEEALEDNDLPFCTAVFTPYDHSVENKRQIELLRKRISNQIRELLAVTLKEEMILSCWQKIVLYTRRILLNVVMLGIYTLAGYIILLLIDTGTKQTDDENDSTFAFINALAISGMNVFLPFLLTYLTIWESWSKKETENRLRIARSMVVRIGTLSVVIFSIINVDDAEYCLHTRVGQEFYRLMLADAVVSIGVTLSYHWGMAMINKMFYGLEAKVDFDMPMHILEIVYKQAIIWIGAVFSPIIVVIAPINLWLTFVVKQWTFERYVKLPDDYYTASKSTKFFLIVMLLNLLVCFIPVAYIAYKKPVDCGPSEGDPSMWYAVQNLVNEGPGALADFLRFIFEPSFLVPVIVVLGCFMYYQRAANRKQIRKLRSARAQLRMERSDKRYLLKVFGVGDM